MKKTLKAILGLFIVFIIYIIFVLDRLIVAVFPVEQKSFMDWSDMDIKEELRSTRQIQLSVIRIVVVSILILIINWIL
jgi:hypothetical protein